MNIGSHKKNQKGAGLVEVLVTLFILSVGLLGIAGLQATGIQAGQGASLRTTALLVVEDITSRMKANKFGVYTIATDLGYYDSGTADNGTNNGCSDTSSATAVTCTSAQMAAHDIFLWKTSLNAILPSPTGEVVTTVLLPKSNGLVAVTVTITWLERGDTKTYTSEFRVLAK